MLLQISRALVQLLHNQNVCIAVAACVLHSMPAAHQSVSQSLTTNSMPAAHQSVSQSLTTSLKASNMCLCGQVLTAAACAGQRCSHRRPWLDADPGAASRQLPTRCVC